MCVHKPTPIHSLPRASLWKSQEEIIHIITPLLLTRICSLLDDVCCFYKWCWICSESPGRLLGGGVSSVGRRSPKGWVQRLMHPDVA